MVRFGDFAGSELNCSPLRFEQNGRSILHHASQFDRAAVIAPLVESKADPNARMPDRDRTTPIFWARTAETCAVLLSCKADANAQKTVRCVQAK